MRFLKEEIVFQEVPDEVSILFHITNCPYKCKGCHSSEVNKPNVGKILTNKLFREILMQYQGLATCVVFWGGEWERSTLIEKLQIARELEYSTCLYSGLDDISDAIFKELTYLKVGSYQENCGGLDSETTNQRFYRVSTMENLNYRFQRKFTHKLKGESNDDTNARSSFQ